MSYFLDSDINHGSAVEVINRISSGEFDSPFISDYVFDETITAVFVKSGLNDAIFAGDRLRRSIEILKVDQDTLDNSWKLFKGQNGTKLSFTDCTIIALMDDKRMKSIATFDKEFKKVQSIKIVN